MGRTFLDRARQAVREFFLLEQAERGLPTLTLAQRDSVEAYCDAARRRQSAAQDLRAPNHTPVALALYREAGFLFALAFLVSLDERLDAGGLMPGDAFRRLDSALQAQGVNPPSSFETARPWLALSHPLAFDRVAADAAIELAGELEATLRWLAGLLDLRSARQLHRMRIFRLAAAAGCALALVVGLATWTLSPTNLAFQKLARSSVPAFNTTPAGAVDGDKEGSFGFHSQEEDSPWLAVDLARRHHITSIKVFGRGDCCFDQSIPLALELSNDGVSFRAVAVRMEPFSQTTPWEIDAPQVARFVRLRTERRSVLVLSELEVYGHWW